MYIDGNTNPSDFLSRHPCPETDNKHETPVKNYVNFITTHAVPKAMTVKEIQDATKNDENCSTSLKSFVSKHGIQLMTYKRLQKI